MQEDVLGRYRVGRVLGIGGMGVVHEAIEEGSGRRLALKLIAPHLARDPAFRDRFVREARALTALDSAHVVRVHDHGEVDGRLFLATELVPDGDLAHLLREPGPPPVPIALELVTQVAQGLHDAHSAGLVHRDVKPANVFLRRQGGGLAACLGDFGVAREARADGTRTDTVGTPAFMAPELHTGGVAGVRSDIYSLGCLLWTTLTGRPPYTAATEYQLATAHREEPLPQLAGAERLDEKLNRVLCRAMAKDPDERYASAAEVRDDLVRIRRLADGTTAVRLCERLPSPTSLPSRRAGSVARVGARVVAVAVAAAAAAVVGLLRPDAAAPPTSTATTLVDRSAAAMSLAHALEAEGSLSTRQSRCVADQWIETAGLSTMVSAGLFDTHLRWVEQTTDALTPPLRRAAVAAAARCAGR